MGRFLLPDEGIFVVGSMSICNPSQTTLIFNKLYSKFKTDSGQRAKLELALELKNLNCKNTVTKISLIVRRSSENFTRTTSQSVSFYKVHYQDETSWNRPESASAQVF